LCSVVSTIVFVMRKKQIAIECEYSKLADPGELRDHPRNPHKHPQKQIKALAANIKQFGWRHPIVVSKLTGHIGAGHGRKLAAIELGCKAPVDEQDFKTEDDELAVLLADNLIPELAEMDKELLKANKDLIEEAGFDLELIGWENFDFEIPEENKEIDEEELSLTRNECPKCGFKW